MPGVKMLSSEDLRLMHIKVRRYRDARKVWREIRPKTIPNGGTYTNAAHRALLDMEREARELLAYIDADVAALLIEAAVEKEELAPRVAALTDNLGKLQLGLKELMEMADGTGSDSSDRQDGLG